MAAPVLAELQQDWAGLDLADATVHKASEEQEKRWADAEALKNIDGRAHWSVREQYSLHAARFQLAIADFRLARSFVRAHRRGQLPLTTPALARILDFHCLYGPSVAFLHGLAPPLPPPATGELTIAVRKRPLLEFEHARGEWDCVDLQTINASRWAQCHDGRLERSGRRLVLGHRAFPVDSALDEKATDADLGVVLNPLLQWAESGHGSTLLLLGQTGTGKTHTFQGALRLLAQRCGGAGTAMEVQFFEVLGKQCFDLLNERHPVHLRADENDQVHVRGAASLHVDAADLVDKVAPALALRSSKATERNPLSSRSHAVLTVALASGGSLRIVDLAGSERNYETTKMSAAEHRAFAENSQSLMALRSCFRALHTAGRKPYRSSRLTHLLKDSFSPPHRTCVLATVSPSATDQIHTIHTLEILVALCPRLESRSASVSVELPVALPPVHVPVEQWTAEELDAWLGTVENGRFAKLTLPPGMDGAALLQIRDIGNAFDRTMRDARDTNEGTSWNVKAHVKTDVYADVFKALEKEQTARGGRMWPFA